MTELRPTSKSMLWTGRALGLLIMLFLLFDAVTKVLRLDFVVKATVEAGFSASVVVPIGCVLLISVIIYAIPRTAILGAILLTGYLGGAVATNVRRSSSLGFDLFPAIMGVLAWAALYLRDTRLREMIPVRRDE